jgi:hypothetical protein
MPPKRTRSAQVKQAHGETIGEFDSGFIGPTPCFLPLDVPKVRIDFLTWFLKGFSSAHILPVNGIGTRNGPLARDRNWGLV